jgi:ketosteroid isomerase-like protein
LFDVFALEPDGFIECGEHVVVPNRTYMQGRDGIKVEAQSASVVTLHDGRIVEWRLYLDRDEALKAVGLSD